MEQSPHMHTPSDETGARTSMTQDFTEAVAGPLENKQPITPREHVQSKTAFFVSFIGTIANLIQE
jgi:hypothetical protein